MMLQPIGKEEAARAFEACAGLDPEGVETPQSAAAAGQCFRLTTDTGRMVLSVGGKGRALWCFAAAGEGEGMTDAGLNCLEMLASATGYNAVTFQTMRRGLAKRARARGYAVIGQAGAGNILQKAIA